MAIDIAGSLDWARTEFEAALRVIGTRVSLGQPGAVTAVDRTTLQATATASAPYATDVPAMIKDASQLRAMPYPAAEPVPTMQWQISMPIEHTPEKGHVITVEACRDARWIGRQFIVDAVKGSSAGVARQVLAKLVPVGGKA